MDDREIPQSEPRLLSIAYKPEGNEPPYAKAEHIVTFSVGYGARVIPIALSFTAGEFDDGRLMQIARSVLHDFACSLEEATRPWRMSDADRPSDFPDGNPPRT